MDGLDPALCARPEEVIPSAAIDAGSWEYEIIQRRIQSRSTRLSLHYRRMRVRFERAPGGMKRSIDANGKEGRKCKAGIPGEDARFRSCQLSIV